MTESSIQSVERESDRGADDRAIGWDDAYDDATSGFSRRNLLFAAGAIGGLAAGAVLTGATGVGAAPATLPTVGPFVQAVGPADPALTYIAIDAQQFWPTDGPRVYQDMTGTQPLNPGRIWAGLPLPVGSVIRQIDTGYQVQPIVEVSRRPITASNPALPPAQVFQKTLAASPGGPFSSTETLPAPGVTIEAGYSYTVSYYLGAGSSVFGASIGYVPATQSFIPYSGPNPRVLDTRESGPGKLAKDEERIVDLGFAGARSAVINLTVTETVEGGFVAVYRADIAYPGTSSVNWASGNSNVANGVITQMDGLGRIKIRGGARPTHVVIDRIGFLV